MTSFNATIQYIKSLAGAMVLAVVAIGSISLEAQEFSRERYLGRKAEDFTLPDVKSAKPWKLSEQIKQAEATVLYFNSTECPVTNRYLPTLIRLYAEFADRKVAIVTVNSNQHNTAEEIAEHAREFKLELPILCDAEGKVARSLGVMRTAEAILLDSQGKLRYRGVIDDRYERGVTRPRANNEYLADAIEAVLQRRMVKTSITDVEACPLNLAAPDEADDSGAQTTYSEHVAPIMQRRCQQCHRQDGIGPFKLMTYDDAESWSESIREVVTQNLMPPWHADAPHKHFSNDRSLTDKEYSTLLDWIDDGTLEGDRSKLPKPLRFTDSWTIGTPEVVLKMEKAVTVPAETPELGVPYKYIWAGEPFAREMWVTAAEVHPGATDVVHHASVYIVPEGIDLKLKNDERPTGLLADWTSPINALPHLVSFVPGDNAFVREDGFAMRIPKGARLIFEMHYTPTGKQAIDRTEVGLKFASKPPTYEVYSDALINYWFSIPPGAVRHQVQAKSPKFKRDSVLLTMNPHMHYRGKAFTYELLKPSGETTLLLNVPNYNFEWQTTYTLAKPIDIPRGSRIVCTATFDNSKDNPFNPDPTVRVEWGEQTWQEMMLAGFEFYEK